MKALSLPVQGAWIEIALKVVSVKSKSGSLPVQGAWIEIAHFAAINYHHRVAPRAGSVD